ncbi:MAG: hypothetical protein ABEI99_11240 [Halobaculum sp.]
MGGRANAHCTRRVFGVRFDGCSPRRHDEAIPLVSVTSRCGRPEEAPYRAFSFSAADCFVIVP